MPLETMNPKIVSKQIMSAHFTRFRLMPYSLHLKKHFLSFSKMGGQVIDNNKII